MPLVTEDEPAGIKVEEFNVASETAEVVVVEGVEPCSTPTETDGGFCPSFGARFGLASEFILAPLFNYSIKMITVDAYIRIKINGYSANTNDGMGIQRK